MTKIWLFGGRSELGNSAASELLRVSREKVSGITKIQRAPAESLGEDCIIWAPDSTQQVFNTLNNLTFSKGDIAVIAVGSINENDSALKFKLLSRETIEELIWINYTLPLVVTSEVSKRLAVAGGGSLVVFTSAAALPPQAENLIYSNSKRALDSTLGFLSGSFKKSGVKIFRVRSSFSPTPLNKGRSATPLKVSSKKVGRAIGKAYLRGQGVIWVPRIFRFVSLVLRVFPLLTLFAGKLVRRSRAS